MPRLLVLIFTIISLTSQAQIPDVPAAFNAIKAKPEVLHLKKNHIETPSGGHLQGIQCLSDSELIITASSGSYAYYLTGNRTELKSIVKLSDGPFRHAGGCQAVGNSIFAVGVEDNVGKDSSEILLTGNFYPDEGPLAFVAAKRSGVFKRSTAGAVGITHTREGLLLAVADWDSRNIDFYIPKPINGNAWNFDSLTTFQTPSDYHWPSYQSINLLTDTAGKIYLIGFALEGIRNHADLFEVVFHPGKTELKRINTRNFRCRSTSFRYGSGIYMNNGHLSIYSCGRNAGHHTQVNIFR